MMNRIHYTKPDMAQAFFWMHQRLTASESTGGGSISFIRQRANIPATPPYEPEVPPDPESPINPSIPDTPDEFPHENPPEIEEPTPDVITVPVREPPLISGRAPVRHGAPRS